MQWIRTMALVACGVAVACGDPADPAAMDEGGSDETGSTGAMEESATQSRPSNPTAPATEGDTDVDPDDSGDATDTDDDTGDETDGTTGDPPGACQPPPSRLVVLGDSITACYGVGGPDSEDCAPQRLYAYLTDAIGPLDYENLAVGGAVTSDVSNSQIFDIEVGLPGHAMVMIYVGGNDLSAYILQSDQAAMDGWNDTTGPEVAQAWEEILAFLGDPTNFPDGVTLLMNTQYNPFDDYTAAPYFVSQVKTDLLHAHNDALTARADAQPWAFIADQHPSYLGHGHYVNDPGCPYYDPSFDGWMGDIIHPNDLGHHHLAEVMVDALETQVFADCR